MRTIPVGETALLVEVADVRTASALYDTALRERVSAVDIVPAARTVLFDGVDDPAVLAEQVASWSWQVGGSVHRDRVEVPTVYDGPDLGLVALQWGTGSRDVVALHTGTEFVVAFNGFAPGFAYCSGLPEDRGVARRAEPRTRVPAGSVGLAGEFTGIYPSDSPGGWQLIGRTTLTLWDTGRAVPATLPPGTRVRFVEVDP